MPNDCGLEGLTFTEPSLCKFEFAADCDLHNIISRFLSTGQLPEGREGSSVDVTNTVSDFTDLQNRIVFSQQAFEQLPIEEQQKYGSVENWLEQSLERSAPTSDPATVDPSSVPSVDDKPPAEPGAGAGGAASSSDS